MNTAVATALDRLIENYREGSLSRREFFQRLAYLTGSIVLAHEIMLDSGLAAEWEIYNWPDPPAQQGQPAPTPKESIAAGEQRLPAQTQAEWVKYPSGEFQIGGYLARPKTGSSFASIIIIHENRGLTEFVIDMAQRWAGEGLLAIAPDLLSRAGGTAGFATMQEAGQGIGKLVRADVVSDLHATVAYLKSRADVNKNKIGITGFCWGGANTFNFATESKDLLFAAPFYGRAPEMEKLANIVCPVFAVYAELDQGVNSNLDEVEAKMKELGKTYTRKMYPGAQHAFMNYTSPQRYNAEQAKAAWADVTAFVKKTIG
jgi:carboxymethylenebutenolidase